MKQNDMEEFRKLFNEAAEGLGLSEEDIGDPFDSAIVLEDEDGNEIEFELIDEIEFEDKDYAILVSSEEDGITIMEIAEEDGEECFFDVVDERVLNAVFEKFKENFASLEQFMGEDEDEE